MQVMHSMISVFGTDHIGECWWLTATAHCMAYLLIKDTFWPYLPRCWNLSFVNLKADGERL